MSVGPETPARRTSNGRASRCGQRHRWAASTAAQSGSPAGSRLPITSASSASRHRPEVTSGQARPALRSGPLHWRTSVSASMRVPAGLASALSRRGVACRRGEVLLACSGADEQAVLEEVRRLGLECQLTRNRAELMVLPAGVSKGTGLAAGLADLGISAHNAVAVGDAENDHSLLAAAELGVAVANRNLTPAIIQAGTLSTRRELPRAMSGKGTTVTVAPDAGIRSSLPTALPDRGRRRALLTSTPPSLPSSTLAPSSRPGPSPGTPPSPPPTPISTRPASPGTCGARWKPVLPSSRPRASSWPSITAPLSRHSNCSSACPRPPTASSATAPPTWSPAPSRHLSTGNGQRLASAWPA